MLWCHIRYIKHNMRLLCVHGNLELRKHILTDGIGVIGYIDDCIIDSIG